MSVLDTVRPNLGAEPKVAAGDGAGVVLQKIFQTLDRAQVRYCVLHGYEDLPQKVSSDIDLLVDPAISPAALTRLLQVNGSFIGAEVVLRRGSLIVLAARRADGSHIFIPLDAARHCDVEGARFVDPEEILSSRRRHDCFWIPAPEIEFTAYLARSMLRGDVSARRGERLTAAFRQAPVLCAHRLAAFCAPQSVGLISAAASTGHWDEVSVRLPALAAEIHATAVRRHRLRFVMNTLHIWGARAWRLLRPAGISMALMGPDGAGKSSVLDGLPDRLAPLFPRHVLRGFAPGLLAAFRSGPRRTDTPHALKQRSWPVSLLRIGYWVGWHIIDRIPLRLAMARSTLLLHDRGFADILVDQRRYRYGGPVWLLRLVWALAPKPALIILLDAPAEVLQQRKQEVPFEVTARQREAYLALVSRLRNGRVVDATRPLPQVLDNVTALVIEHLAKRYRRSLPIPPRVADAAPLQPDAQPRR